MTGESVFIVTDGLPSVGDVVNLRLSFPRTVRPLMVSVRVRQVRMATGPGNPPGFVADFEIDSDDVKQRVIELARRIRPTSGMAPPSRELSVLLVEDNQLIRDMFAYAVDRYFSQRARKVHLAQAASVGAAWKHLEARRDFDLAVVDHMLPDETGASFITTLRRHGTFRRMPIVGMSVGGSDVRSAMLDAGADLFLHKPIVLKDLFCTLEFLMDASGSERGAA
ncbi:MAG: Chemotaxis protein CheY [Labilithrix sp.]|nr:Chemotaxis protein CheY [Labilithrix sp.]